MFTQCPECKTIFGFNEEHTQVAGGQVRCSQCSHVFDAMAHSMEELPDADETQPASETTATPPPEVVEETAVADETAPEEAPTTTVADEPTAEEIPDDEAFSLFDEANDFMEAISDDFERPEPAVEENIVFNELDTPETHEKAEATPGAEVEAATPAEPAPEETESSVEEKTVETPEADSSTAPEAEPTEPVAETATEEDEADNLADEWASMLDEEENAETTPEIEATASEEAESSVEEETVEIPEADSSTAPETETTEPDTAITETEEETKAEATASTETPEAEPTEPVAETATEEDEADNLADEWASMLDEEENAETTPEIEATASEEAESSVEEETTTEASEATEAKEEITAEDSAPAEIAEKTPEPTEEATLSESTEDDEGLNENSSLQDFLQSQLEDLDDTSGAGPEEAEALDISLDSLAEKPAEQKPAKPKQPAAQLEDEISDSLIEDIIPSEDKIPSWGINLVWVAGILISLVLLTSQYIYTMRDDLSQIPSARPWVIKFCETTECEVPLYSNLDQLEFVSQDVRSHPRYQNALMVTIVLINRSPFYQAYPVIEFRLSDINQNPVAGRYFLPSAYLDASVDVEEGIKPDVPVRAVIEINDPGEQAINYDFDFR